MTTQYVWSGSKVRLRPVKPEDWESYHNNDLDSENARLCDEIHFPRSEEGTQKWAEEQSNNATDGDNVFLAIETHDGTLVGSMNTWGSNARTGTFKYGISIFRAHWRNGYATDAVKTLLRYYFEELRYHKVNAHVYAFNDRSAAFQKRLGFKLEGTLRDMIYTKGRHYDEYIYGLTKAEFEQLYG